MTLDEFITLQKINLEKFRWYYARRVEELNLPINQSFEEWEINWEEWGKFSKETEVNINNE